MNKSLRGGGTEHWPLHWQLSSVKSETWKGGKSLQRLCTWEIPTKLTEIAVTTWLVSLPQHLNDIRYSTKITVYYKGRWTHYISLHLISIKIIPHRGTECIPYSPAQTLLESLHFLPFSSGIQSSHVSLRPVLTLAQHSTHRALRRYTAP